MTTAATTEELAALAPYFQLRPDMTFLNHGSFGACPLPVFETFQEWQRELERQPVEFLGRRVKGLLAEARQGLGDYVGAAPTNLVFMPNVTAGMNAVARSLRLEAGDEVLATDHEYGAVDRTWRYNCSKTGARYINQPIPLPLTTPEAFVEQFWAGVTPKTKVISVSHITSSTALIFPIAEICERARAAGILTVIDGAHAPGQIDLRLDDLGADFYLGNCHKWLCAPKGAGFLYARAECQELLDPLIVSWGWEADSPSSSRFLDHYEWAGTDDPASYLSVPAAIAFQRAHNWPRVQAACHALVAEGRRQIGELTGLPSIAPDSTTWWGQMATIPLRGNDAGRLKDLLWDTYQIEIPIMLRGDQLYARLSIQAYNRQADIATLVNALREVM